MKHYHSHTALFIVAASVTLFVFALYAYMHYGISASIERVIAGRSKLAEHDLSLSRENNLSSVHEATAGDRVKAASFFVPDDSTVSFIETVEALGTSAGSSISLSSIEADNIEAAEPGTISRIRAHVDVRGSWSAVMKTLKLAETLPYAVTVSRVRLDTSGALDPKAGRSREWRASFVIEGLSLKSSKQ
ncbi:MAG: hypothetical protein AAB365_03115 [Patescibacteria group bacterium]